MAVIKIAAVYTGCNAALVGLVEDQLKAAMPDTPYQVLTFANPQLIDAAIENGGVTPYVAKHLVKAYMDAVFAGADVVYSICSTIGDVAETVKPLFRLFDVPFVRIDEEMANAAIEAGRRIGLVATIPTILEPSKRLIQKCIREKGSNNIIIDILVDGSFGKPRDVIGQMIIEKVKSMADQLDIVVLTQASLGPIENTIADAVGKRVFTSSAFGARAIADVVARLQR
jgi:Ni,Fe-hydrogenase III small subunit